MANEVDELVGFLSCPSPQVKKSAVEIVRGLTGSDEWLTVFANCSERVLSSLCQLMNEKKEIAVPAVEALVNMSQDANTSEKLITMGMVEKVIEMLTRNKTVPAQSLIMLLVNLTQSDDGISSLLQINDLKVEGLHLLKLVRLFCHSHGDEKEDPFEHIGSILVNVSRTKIGRNLLLNPERSLLKQIIPQIDSNNLLRKKGVLATIRNCCFEAEDQLQQLLLISEFLWPALLLPVAGKKVYSQADTSKMPVELANPLSHEREAIDDPDIRVLATEAISLIAMQEDGLRSLWSVNGPRILQVGYEDEDDPKVMEAYEKLGSLLVQSGMDLGPNVDA